MLSSCLEIGVRQRVNQVGQRLGFEVVREAVAVCKQVGDSRQRQLVITNQPMDRLICPVSGV